MLLALRSEAFSSSSEGGKDQVTPRLRKPQFIPSSSDYVEEDRANSNDVEANREKFLSMAGKTRSLHACGSLNSTVQVLMAWNKMVSSFELLF